MKAALDEYIIRGVANNINFLRDILENPNFVSGDYSTKFIEKVPPFHPRQRPYFQEYPEGFNGAVLGDAEFEQLQSLAVGLRVIRTIRDYLGGQPQAEVYVPPFFYFLHFYDQIRQPYFVTVNGVTSRFYVDVQSSTVFEVIRLTGEVDEEGRPLPSEPIQVLDPPLSSGSQPSLIIDFL